MKILLSIKPKFANKIFCGEKKFEYRKSVFKNENIKTVVVYSTMPVGKIIGEFTIKQVHKDEPCKIWSKTRQYAGIDEISYNQYFEGREHGFAIEISEITLYEHPIDPKEIFDDFSAPQSFQYLNDYDFKLAERKNICVIRNK